MIETLPQHSPELEPLPATNASVEAAKRVLHDGLETALYIISDSEQELSLLVDTNRAPSVYKSKEFATSIEEVMGFNVEEQELLQLSLLDRRTGQVFSPYNEGGVFITENGRYDDMYVMREGGLLYTETEQKFIDALYSEPDPEAEIINVSQWTEFRLTGKDRYVHDPKRLKLLGALVDREIEHSIECNEKQKTFAEDISHGRHERIKIMDENYSLAEEMTKEHHTDELELAIIEERNSLSSRIGRLGAFVRSKVQITPPNIKTV